MEVEQFIKKVTLLRKYQRSWFDNHVQSDLQLAKKLEKDVDKALEEGIIIPILDTRPDPPDGKGQQLPLIQDVPVERFNQFE